MFITISHAKAYWCPSGIVCAGIDVVTCRYGNWGDTWKLDPTQRYGDVADAYFHFVSANYETDTGKATCAYNNNSSQGLSLVPINAKLYPIFDPDFKWKWGDPTKEWASCVSQDKCPFREIK